MKTRKQYIEEIMRNMHAIRGKFVAKWRSKSNKQNMGFGFGAKITSSQWMALATVMRNENISMTGLAESLGISTSAATQLVDELVGNGYLLRVGKSDDRRALSLTLSATCKKKIGDMKTKHAKQFEHMFDALTDNELKQYAMLNKKIVESILKNKSKL